MGPPLWPAARSSDSNPSTMCHHCTNVQTSPVLKPRTVKWYLRVFHVFYDSAAVAFHSVLVSLQNSRLQEAMLVLGRTQSGFIRSRICAICVLQPADVGLAEVAFRVLLSSNILPRFNSRPKFSRVINPSRYFQWSNVRFLSLYFSPLCTADPTHYLPGQVVINEIPAFSKCDKYLLKSPPTSMPGTRHCGYQLHPHI